MARPGFRRLFGSLCLLVLAVPAVNAAPLSVYESPEEKVAVLELYTSHGCSSCPPADAWLRTLAEQPGLWNEFIPLAFHVDYWNDLGWPDQFAAGVYSDRQREYFRKGHISSVYTPGFVLRGREWRGWFNGRAPELSPGARVGKLSLALHDDQRALIRFNPQESANPPQLIAHVAILGFGLTTAVNAGENRGRTLEEDFVVLGYRASRQNSAAVWDLALPDVVDASTSRRAIVAWISTGAAPVPVQAVGGWLPPGTQRP